MNIVKSRNTRKGGGGERDADRALAQLAAVKEEERGGALLAWPTTADSPHSTDHNGNLYFRLDKNKTGLDAKANLELYKSKRVCSVVISIYIFTLGGCTSYTSVRTIIKDWCNNATLSVYFLIIYICTHMK